MPTALKSKGYRFFFYSNEGNEPPHIHVERAECCAKYWLDPVSLARSLNFPDKDLPEFAARGKGPFEYWEATNCLQVVQCLFPLGVGGEIEKYF